MNLKVLKLDYWMYKNDNLFQDTVDYSFIPIEPILNRNGFYKLGKKVWFELDGLAYQSKDGSTYFDMIFREHNTRFLLQKEINAIRILIAARLASKEQIQILNDNLLHQSFRRSDLQFYKIKKQMGIIK